jgi:glycosyltransferase involved in cell wall biosynthesis
VRKRPTISIIMSNYNCGKYIWRTLESIIAQTYTDWEAIVVDDGSTDNSREVILSYAQKDSRIKPFLLQENRGMCFGLNYALEHALGTYYARIDSDDFWEPEKLEIQMKYMETHPNCGACFTWVRVVDEDEKPVPSYLCEERDKIYNSENRSRAQWLRTFFFEGCKLCHPTALIRKEAIDKVGKYNYIYKQIQDYDLWIRIAKHYDIHVIPQKLINYRWFVKSGANASASNPGVATRGLMEAYLVFTKFNDDLPDDLFYEAFHNDFFISDATTHDELACERALLMYHKSYLGNTGKAIGLKMLDALFNQASTKEILEKRYYITAKTFAEWTSYPIFGDSVYIMQAADGQIDELTFKNLMKKKLKPHKTAFAFCRRVYQPIKKLSYFISTHRKQAASK